MDKFEPIVKTYYDALEEGDILCRKCSRCGAYSYPPMPVCHECSSTEVQWAKLSGDGKLLSFGALNDHHVWPDFKARLAPEDLPVRWGEIELVEGPAITGMVVGIHNEEEVRSRLPVVVHAEIIQDDGFKTTIFRFVD